MNDISIAHLYISPGHNFFGHHGQPPGEHPIVEVEEVRCVTGCGVVGDRFYGHMPGYAGEITFFELEVYEELCRTLDVSDRHPGVFRRNVTTRGVRLNDLIGRRFSIQGVEFLGVAHCSPCYWMDHAFAPMAEKALAGKGGLRARILTDGVLRADSPRYQRSGRAGRSEGVEKL